MWGDSDHIRSLKEQEQPWPNAGKPLTEKDLKTLKAAEKGGFISKDALKAAQKQGRKGGYPDFDKAADMINRHVEKLNRKAELAALKQQLDQDAKAAKRSQTEQRRGDLADLKAAEREAKQARRAEKDRQRALRDTIKAEKAARKEQQRAEAEAWQWSKEEKAAWKAAKRSGQYQTYSEPSYAPDLAQLSSGISCLGTMVSFALLAGLFLLVLLCFCGCY